MKSVLSLVMILASFIACAHDATYFRAWQGFKNPVLSNEKFLSELPLFMQETVELYAGQALVNYIVVLPPKIRPAFIPDELALVALTSKEDYQRIRQTPEGQKYGERHWDLFNKENSKSADPMIDFQTVMPKTLVHNQSYDVIGCPINWQNGFTTVYIGTRKSHLSASAFLEKLKDHVSLVLKAMSKQGLNAYIVIANNDYEVAYMNWESKEARDNAFKTHDGAAVVKDGELILEHLIYQEASPYQVQVGEKVEEGKVYSTMSSEIY